MNKIELWSGTPNHMGARYLSDDAYGAEAQEGTNFAVFSAHASKIELCIFSEDGDREVARQALPERTGHIWHGFAPDLKPGTKYGFRAHGAYAPEQGHRFNPQKLLMDPYTRELHGQWRDHNSTYGYKKNARNVDLSFDTTDSAPFVAKSVVSDPAVFNPAVPRLAQRWDDAFIYEAHAKGLTQQHAGVPENIRGTYEGLASEPMLEHLHKLGVTAIELLPVHSFLDDAFLLEKGLRNYWGYNTIGFFAPEPRYFGPAGFAGFRAMVKRFHQAGIKVILDVVYNHTAEGDQRGPTLCYRGLDNASYYRLISGQPRYYVNDTGCGNTLNIADPHVLRMVLDSLRFWVEHMGVDGFRFDLATTLGREDHGFDPRGGFFDAIRQDPVLCDVRLIAEPWDMGPGGYRVGDFPAPFSEWNDGFRDNVKRYWRGDHHSAQELGARLLGSAGEFDKDGRRAWSSVNFITAHDGFTLNDLTSYNERHNEANGENGADGHGENLSDNCGVEGPTDDLSIQAKRDRRRRSMLATLLLSQGTPMMLAGDEMANSQNGNNNAYCQDNEIGWVDWSDAETDFARFVGMISGFRKEHAALRQDHFLHGGIRSTDQYPDVEWRSLTGTTLDWRDPGLSSFCLLLRCSAEATPIRDDTVFLVFNRGDAADVHLPDAPHDHHWVRAIDTAHADFHPSDAVEPALVSIAEESVVAFAARHNSVGRWA